ncbi:MAG: sensor histidine kinase, partial [Oscillospiraceae bacterium]
DMLQEIRDLMDNVVQEQKLKRDAEILSLQTQINPHLLYNTLASIRFLVFTGDKKTADNAILALIRLMKNTLSDAREFVTVENEFDLLQDYIQLQRLAFDRPVEVSVDVDDNILDCKIIKLLLQPVVENAFLHGLKPKAGSIQLCIAGKADQNDLVFTVEDNGVGFDTEKANYTDKDPASRSVGLRNVHNRIVLTFGEGYGLTVQSTLSEGTAVTLRIPLIRSKGEYSSYEHFGGG